MKNIDFATATRLDLEIWDTQNKIKYIKLPTRHARKSELILSQTKGVRTNTNRGKINSLLRGFLVGNLIYFILFCVSQISKSNLVTVAKSMFFIVKNVN